MSERSTSLPDFLRHVAVAAFANPFLRGRREADRVLAGATDASGDWTPGALAEVRAQVERLHRAGRADIRTWSGEGQRDLAVALLFDLFHQYAAALDRHIVEQRALGDRPLRAAFAPDLLQRMERHGFSSHGRAHYLSVFFQLRRAYLFISQGLTGRSSAMEHLRARLWTNLFTHDIRWYDQLLWDRMEDFSTLLTGPTGTGKGTAAQALGLSCYIPYDERSGTFRESFAGAYRAINLSQFPASLIESELFGHRKGAFTGAVEPHTGILERCSRYGAIFLDEIGEVDAALQIKLLTVLQERRFTPVGSHELKAFRGRVIAATNRPPDALRGAQGLRPDFYYRLTSDVIEVPRLRARLDSAPEELHDLIEVLVARLTGDRASGIVDLIESRLRADLPPDYPWPGNVRELEQAVRRILLTGRYEPEADLRQDVAVSGSTDRLGDEPLTAHQLLARHARHLYRRLGTYEAVAQRLQLDRRTVRKYIRDVIPDSTPDAAL